MSIMGIYIYLCTGYKMSRYKKVRNKIPFIWRFIHERRIKTCDHTAEENEKSEKIKEAKQQLERKKNATLCSNIELQ